MKLSEATLERLGALLLLPLCSLKSSASVNREKSRPPFTRRIATANLVSNASLKFINFTIQFFLCDKNLEKKIGS